ncbi:MAG: hypothetical protein KJ927_15080, partial [Candidatus Eisenbacteria bacterium]|nr:hypothetical protein [Candidatus Eisenbacteria bacterium]
MTESADAWKGYKEAILERIDFQDLFVDLKQARSSGDGWISALCPFHADTSPSFGFNPQTGQWCCHAGCGKGSAFDFLMHTSGKDFKSTLIELGDRLGVPRPSSADSTRPPIDEGLINQWATYLRETETAGRCLREQRGLTQDTIRRYQIGWDPKRQRYTIPVRDERGKVVNIRLYSTSEKPKIINYTDAKHKYGSPARLYGLKEMANDTGDQVVLCEGEWDRLILQQEGFMAVTGTHGATTFRPEWASLFKDKDVVIIYDCDTEGRAAVQNIVLKALKESEARSIKNVILPLSGEKNDKDVTDFFMKGGHTATDLQKIIDDTPVHSFKIEEEPEDVFDLQSFTEIERADLIDKKVR